MATLEITQENFQETVDNNTIVILDFWAQWCGPCRAFAPVFEDAANEHQDIVFGKINTEEQPGLAQRFQVSSIPTLVVFKERVNIFQQPGALPAHVLSELVTKVRGIDVDEARKAAAAG